LPVSPRDSAEAIRHLAKIVCYIDRVSSRTGADDTDLVAPRAVIFDFFGTIACHPAGVASEYPAVFKRHGYELGVGVEALHFARYDGAEHLEHSTDRATYEAWARFRRNEFAMACGVDPADLEGLVDDLVALDATPVVAYPDAAPTLEALRARGFRIGVCSNWGWELQAYLAEANLLGLVDVAVTSARVGARKPHPRIFAAVTDGLEVPPWEALFVGDSLVPDVAGPLEIGMAAVHVWRPEDTDGATPPELPAGAERVSSLSALLDWPVLQRAGPGPLVRPR
jgi:putative hydrolase of the HAD superfamily